MTLYRSRRGGYASHSFAECLPITVREIESFESVEPPTCERCKVRQANIDKRRSTA